MKKITWLLSNFSSKMPRSVMFDRLLYNRVIESYERKFLFQKLVLLGFYTESIKEESLTKDKIVEVLMLQIIFNYSIKYYRIWSIIYCRISISFILYIRKKRKALCNLRI